MVEKTRGRKEEVVTREYTINLHKGLHGWSSMEDFNETRIDGVDREIVGLFRVFEEQDTPLQCKCSLKAQCSSVNVDTVKDIFGIELANRNDT
ncbi:hypothetical protein V6N11_054741 [Hibiscus sabdariffa]|uniref:Uncharacterized protein n=1 Tax=Hibiscus sabdariffa TaxID=183260 RepID=A0ABR2S4U0_9ROSI